jgi:hypothetical protein
VIAGEGLDPLLIRIRALTEDCFVDGGHADHLPEEVHDLLGSR